MTQVAFKDGTPAAGTGFAFFEEADKAIVAYLQNTGSLHTGDRLDLANFLATEVANFRAHEPPVVTRIEGGLRLDESQTIQGVKATVYVWTGQYRKRDWTSASMNIECITQIRIWTQDTNPQEAGRRCMEVSGAIASLMMQTLYTQASGFDWTDYYAAGLGASDEATDPFPISSDACQVSDGRARQILTFSWNYYEAFA